MSAGDALAFYELGWMFALGIGGGPMLVVVLARWAKSFLSMR
jgi:hypothetical protein